MAKRILSSKNQGASHHQQQGPQYSQWSKTTHRGMNGTSRIAPAVPSMSSSRSEANLPRLPDGNHHPSLDHFGGNGNHHLTMLKTKVWYHSQRNVQQEASV